MCGFSSGVAVLCVVWCVGRGVHGETASGVRQVHGRLGVVWRRQLGLVVRRAVEAAEWRDRRP